MMRGTWRGSKPRRHRNPEARSKRRWRKFRWRPPRIGRVAGSRANTPAERMVARYAAGTLVQAGPGIPRELRERIVRWSGPVARSNGALHRLGPLAVALWRIAGVALLAWFFIRLARTSFGMRLRLPGFRGPAAQWAPCCSRASPRPSRRRASPRRSSTAQRAARSSPRGAALRSNLCRDHAGANPRQRGSDADRPESERVAPLQCRTVRRGSLAIDSVAVDGALESRGSA